MRQAAIEEGKKYNENDAIKEKTLSFIYNPFPGFEKSNQKYLFYIVKKEDKKIEETQKRENDNTVEVKCTKCGKSGHNAVECTLKNMSKGNHYY